MNWNTTTTEGDKEVVYNLEFMSLYDYLGKAAGPELGQEVAQAAVREKVSITTKEVATRTYTGTILMYPRPWLEKFFAAKAAKEDQFELPF